MAMTPTNTKLESIQRKENVSMDRQYFSIAKSKTSLLSMPRNEGCHAKSIDKAIGLCGGLGI
eukprot:13036096-Ditylum_brightwellii.AAC.1